MLCQKCHEHPATVFFSKTVGNETTQSHLCEACAREQGKAYGALNPFMAHPFAAISDFLNNFMNWEEAPASQGVPGPAGRAPAPPAENLQCPHCGYQLSVFRQNGRLGCTHCYESFRRALEPVVSGIHGKVRHAEEGTTQEEPGPPGKTVKASTGDPRIGALREQVKEAVQKERYEEAARLRDEIRRLEKEKS
jgi:protein arginine kinase activator